MIQQRGNNWLKRSALKQRVISHGFLRGHGGHSQQKAQSLVESCIAIILISLIFFGMLQITLKLNAEQVQRWATFLGARSRIVGYADDGVQKMFLVGNILNSGAMKEPFVGLSAVSQLDYETAGIPIYLSAQSPLYNSPSLDYTQWEQLPRMPGYSSGDEYTATVKQSFPLEIARMLPVLVNMLPHLDEAPTSFARTNVDLNATATLENHFPFYLEIN